MLLVNVMQIKYQLIGIIVLPIDNHQMIKHAKFRKLEKIVKYHNRMLLKIFIKMFIHEIKWYFNFITFTNNI